MELRCFRKVGTWGVIEASFWEPVVERRQWAKLGLYTKRAWRLPWQFWLGIQEDGERGLVNLEEVRDAIIPWGQVVPVASDEESAQCLVTLSLWECPEDEANVEW